MTDNSRLAAALDYLTRGWAVVQLHGVQLNGACTCGDPGCRSAGKHPVPRRWQAELVLDPAHAARIWAPGAPWNLGIATGEPSGFWALDYDPASATLEAHELFRRFHAATTREHRTGSGGAHLIFAMPPGVEVRNQQGGEGRSPRLPKGLDVRGTGGQIVAPPSVSAKGAYALFGKRAIVRAPAELEALVVTPPEAPRVERPAPAAAELVLDGRWSAYAVRGIAAECEAYAQLVDGRRGEAAAAFMRRVVELANLAGMATGPESKVFELVEAAAERARHNTSPPGGYQQHEVRAQWERAREHVGARAAVPPASPEPIPVGSTAGVMPPFVGGTAASASAASSVHSGRSDGAETVATPTPDDVDLDTFITATSVGEPDGWLDAAYLWVQQHVGALDGLGRERAKTALKDNLGLPKTTFDRIAREHDTAAKAAEAARLEAERAAAHELRRVQLELQGVVLPAPHEPLAVARALLQRWWPDGVARVAYWRGDYYRHVGTHWEITTERSMLKMINLATEHAQYDGGDEKGMQPWRPTPRKAADVLHSMFVTLVARDDALEADRCIALQNGVYDRASGALLPHDPRRFNLSALPFAYDPAATCPGWIDFLRQVLPGEQDAQTLLQQWFGYIVSGRTDMQKILNVYGRPRTGKGTIGRILTDLVGPAAAASPTLPRLAGEFGAQPLIGKSLCYMSDVTWRIRNATEAIDVIKLVSGEDPIDVNRKGKDFWHGKLEARFMIVGNEIPDFADPSGAVRARMMHVNTKVSFEGREDPGLTDRLRAELPGIFNWALWGLRDLERAGRFVKPEGAAEIDEEIRALNSPAVAFLADHAIVLGHANPAGPMPLVDLYQIFRRWALSPEQGIEHPAQFEVFSKHVQAAGVIVKRVRAGEGGKRIKLAMNIAESYTGSLRLEAQPIGGHQ